MTFSIVGRCENTGQLGIAISSSSIAVGARCPWARAGVGAVATQNITLPALGPLVLDLLEAGRHDAAAALQRARESDPFIEYRQLTVIDSAGRTAFFSGAESLGVHNAVAGNQCVAAGNLLSGPHVIDAMVGAFVGTGGALGDRLLMAMQAAVDAGGEAGPVRSAALKIVGEASWPVADLRIDWTEADPIGALAALWRAYQPQMRDYLVRAVNPGSAPSYGVPGDE